LAFVLWTGDLCNSSAIFRLFVRTVDKTLQAANILCNPIGHPRPKNYDDQWMVIGKHRYERSILLPSSLPVTLAGVA